MKDLAFLFAGQGAQKVGMATELTQDRVTALFDTAKTVCPDVVKLMTEGPQAELDRTVNTQPAMFLADLAYAYAAEAKYGKPAAVCGFSVGEVAALTYAGVLTEADGLKVVLERAKAMDAAASAAPGNMVAVVGLEPEQVEKIAASVPNAWAVNYNAPEQTVVACAAESAEALTAAVKAAGGKALALRVSGAFHCPLMASAAEKLQQVLADIPFKTPKMPVFSNVTAAPYKIEPDVMREQLAKQVVSPVQFLDTVINMDMYGITRYVECGPGNVLKGLVKKILPEDVTVC